MPSVTLLKRQYYYYYGDPWYYWIRWVVIGAILLLLALFLLFAYIHARRRLKKGLRPLPYHAWMIPYRQRAHMYDTGYNAAPTGQVPLNAYQYQYPPPVYQPQPYWNQPPQQPPQGYPAYQEPVEVAGAPQKY